MISADKFEKLSKHIANNATIDIAADLTGLGVSTLEKMMLDGKRAANSDAQRTDYIKQCLKLNYEFAKARLARINAVLDSSTIGAQWNYIQWSEESNIYTPSEPVITDADKADEWSNN